MNQSPVQTASMGRSHAAALDPGQSLPPRRRQLLRGLLALPLPAALEAAVPPSVAVGELLPDRPLEGLLGPNRRLAQFRGKPLIINVWASWCGPCRAEMASLETLATRHAAGRFKLIGISTDDDRERAARFLHGAGLSFPNFIDQGLVMENLLGAQRLPLTVLVDAQGRVLAKVVGARDWASPQAVQELQRQLALPP